MFNIDLVYDPQAFYIYVLRNISSFVRYVNCDEESIVLVEIHLSHSLSLSYTLLT